MCLLQRLATAIVILASAAPYARSEQPVDASEYSPAGCYCVGRVGNVDCDYRDEVSLTDVSWLIDHFFISFCHLPNREEANCDGDPAGEITMNDLLILVDHLFISEAELPLCPGTFNSPPNAYLGAFEAGRMYINGTFGDNPAVGIPVRWSIDDRDDHPYYPPPYDCEYRVYGPYTDVDYATLVSRFFVPVFERDDGTVYRYGETPGAFFVVCDTIWSGGVREITCDTVLVDTVLSYSQYGVRDTLLDVDNPDFAQDPVFGHIAVASGTPDHPWTFDTSVVLYDLLANSPADTTRIFNFVFWLRARDADDASVYDPTPALVTMRVVDPQFERDVLVVEWTNSADENGPRKLDSVAAFWGELVDHWLEQEGQTRGQAFDRILDYGRLSSGFTGDKLLKAAMSHRVLVLLQDAAVAGNWARVAESRNLVLTAVQAGASAWLAARVPAGTFVAGSNPSVVAVDSITQASFGAASYRFTGWLQYAMINGARIEDFTGATPTEEFAGPPLAVDSAALHSYYRWSAADYPWLANLGALPEVGTLVPSPGAEVWYRYRSLYGGSPPPGLDYSLQDQPVMIAFENGISRTTLSLFTPYAFDQETARALTAEVLDWLYEPFRVEKSAIGGER